MLPESPASLSDAIGISVQKTHPQQIVHARQLFQQLRQAVAHTEIFAVGGRVLPDQRDFARAGCGQIFRFANYGFEPAAAELSAQFRNDAERARMIAAFRYLDISG